MSNVCLLLNATYEPLRVISLKRAICLILDNRAVVEEQDETKFFSSETLNLAVPKVIRLKYYVQVPFRAMVPLNRKSLMARDKGICQFNDCERAGNTIDHLIPRSKGGTHTWTNVVAACKQCNSRKDDKILGKKHGELDWTIKNKPVAPLGTKWLILGIAPRMEEQWADYLVG